MITISFFGITSAICFLLPVAAILYFRLYRHTSLIALMVYYVLTLLRSVSGNTVPAIPDFQNTWDVAYNYIEIPLMLTALLFFCPARERQQKIHIIIGMFLLFEMVIAFVFGLSPQASVYVMTPGLLIVTSYAFFLLLRQLKFTILHGKNLGRVLMLCAVVFSYGCYLFMFYSYFILGNSNVADIYLLHFVSSSIASVLMSIGLYLMRQRIKELQELKVTRRELQMIFG